MLPSDVKQRTFDFGIRIVRLVQSLPKNEEARVIGRQLLRAGTSVGANYRAACQGRSRPDFISKLGIVEEECDETLYWIDVLVALELIDAHRVEPLAAEGNEILAMIVASIQTARRPNKKS